MGVARNVFPVGTNIGTLVPLIGSYQYSHSVFGCAVTTQLVPALSVDEYAPLALVYATLASDWRPTAASSLFDYFNCFRVELLKYLLSGRVISGIMYVWGVIVGK